MQLERKPILLCVDLGPGSTALARYAAWLAERCNQPLHVLYVMPPVEVESPAEAEQRLHRWVEENLAGLPVDAVILRQGDPANAILGYAAEQDVSLIVLGHRHRSTVERIHTGNTTSQVISLAKVPVVIAPLNLEEEA